MCCLPRFFLAYSCPFTCSYQAKPLVLLSLLREMVGTQTELAVVFTSSVDSTHRLFRLLQLFGGECRHRIDRVAVSFGHAFGAAPLDQETSYLRHHPYFGLGISRVRVKFMSSQQTW